MYASKTKKAICKRTSNNKRKGSSIRNTDISRYAATPSGSCDQQSAWLLGIVVSNSDASHDLPGGTVLSPPPLKPLLSGNKKSHEDERRVEVPFISLAVTCYVRNITKCSNVVKFIRSRSSWSASLFRPCPRSSNTEVLTVIWNLADWGERGVDAVPYMNFGHLRRFHGFHSLMGRMIDTILFPWHGPWCLE